MCGGKGESNSQAASQVMVVMTTNWHVWEIRRERITISKSNHRNDRDDHQLACVGEKEGGRITRVTRKECGSAHTHLSFLADTRRLLSRRRSRGLFGGRLGLWFGRLCVYVCLIVCVCVRDCVCMCVCDCVCMCV